jgi:truncated hemoglobin YjbI
VDSAGQLVDVSAFGKELVPGELDEVVQQLSRAWGGTPDNSMQSGEREVKQAGRKRLTT